MEDQIKLSELLLLLLIFLAPTFAIAGILQLKIIRYSKHFKSLLIIAVISEAILALGIWLSPLHKLFFTLNILGGFAIGSIPLQAGIISATIVTLILWFMLKGHTNDNR